MLKKVCILALVLASIALAEIPKGPAYLKNGTFYNSDGDRFYMIYDRSDSNPQSRMDRAVQQLKNNQVGTHKAGETYWTVLPEVDNGMGDTTNLLLGWYNLDTGNTGWVCVWNSTDTWRYETNAGNQGSIPNGENVMRSWSDDGQTIKITVTNPLNSNGWTASHIQYRFDVPRM